ncbi:MAG: flagellum-specific ATP synthase FliI, partial [Desulfohalobiaceae bacterium]|nr:flagellum-specific ATP synthase FliI [Desulfohalobiaceae bacterium]
LVDPDHLQMSGRIRETLAVYAEQEDLINIGAYKQGANPRIDKALKHIEAVNAFLRQDLREKASLEQTRQEMDNLFQDET